MKLNEITRKFESAFTVAKDTVNKIAEKKTLKIKDITLIPEFEKLLNMEESVLNKMKESMKEEGYKSGHEIHIWKRGKEYILIDGHTRKCAWESLGNKTIPCIIHNFESLEEAKMFAIKEQTNRRNLSGQALLDAVATFNFEKGKGNKTGEKGKASEIIAKQIGVSPKTVDHTRCVLKEATPEQLEAIKKEELSMNQVYHQIQEKKREEEEKKDPSPLEQTLEAPEPQKEKAETVQKKTKVTKAASTREEAFVKGVRHAIEQIRKGVSLEDLEKEIA